MTPKRVTARTPIVPLLSEPRAAASQVNQLLYGHSALVLDRQDNWLKVRGGDGYEGWAHQGYLEAASPDGELPWMWGEDVDLSMGCSIRDEKGATLDLPLGAVVRGRPLAGRSMDLEMRKKTFPPASEAIVASASGFFQGSYYQWGGITPWGADCSGMIQTVFALHGIRLQRDASQQATQGIAVDGGIDGTEAGDLLFFSEREEGSITHVALSMGGSRVVHAAIGRGGHCLEDLNRPDDYGRALISRFRFARRIPLS
ncbi:MAG TPA: NlpC/P60 family protein [Gemmatimonadaceae bacterium]